MVIDKQPDPKRETASSERPKSLFADAHTTYYDGRPQQLKTHGFIYFKIVTTRDTLDKFCDGKQKGRTTLKS